MNNNKFISIVIVNYRAEDSVLNLLKSIEQFNLFSVAEIVVVDNSEALSLLLSADQRIRYIFSGKNIGFGAACNLGAMNSHCDKFLFINPDVVLINKLNIELFERINDGTCVGITLLDEKGVPTVSYGNFPTLRFYLIRALKLDIIFPVLKRIFHIGIAPESILDKTKKVDYLSGAFFGITKKDFFSVGGFDEDYFLYYEEVDLFFRLSEINIECIVLPNISAIHIGSISTGKNSSFKKIEMNKSLKKYFNKRGRPFAAAIASLVSFIIT
jgi:GT2 family glycosyltransferase